MGKGLVILGMVVDVRDIYIWNIVLIVVVF